MLSNYRLYVLQILREQNLEGRIPVRRASTDLVDSNMILRLVAQHQNSLFSHDSSAFNVVSPLPSSEDGLSPSSTPVSTQF